jgi:hypothetical protein
MLNILKNQLSQKARNFLYMRSSLLESLFATESHVTEEYSTLDLTKAKYSIVILFMVEQENVILRITLALLLHVEKEKE